MASSSMPFRKRGISHSFDVVQRHFREMGEEACSHSVIDRPGGMGLTLMGDQLRWMDANGTLRWSCLVCEHAKGVTLETGFYHLSDYHILGPR